MVSRCLIHGLLTREEHLSIRFQGAPGLQPIPMARMEAIPHTAARPETARHAIRCVRWRDNRAINSAAAILAKAKVKMKTRSAAYDN